MPLIWGFFFWCHLKETAIDLRRLKGLKLQSEPFAPILAKTTISQACIVFLPKILT